MFTPDREAHPAVHELKYLQQPVSISHRAPNGESRMIAVDSTNAIATVTIENLYSFLNLSHIVWTWEIASNRAEKTIRTGSLSIEPNLRIQQVPVVLDEVVSRVRQLERTRPWFGNNFSLRIVGVLREENTWAPKGHTIAVQQLPINFAFPNLDIARTPAMMTPRGALRVDKLGDMLQVILDYGDSSWPIVAISQSAGELRTLAPFGRNFLADRATPSFCRAYTDNDRGGMEFLLHMMFPSWFFHLYSAVLGDRDYSYSSHWSMHGLCPEKPPVVECVRVRVTDTSTSDQVGIVVLSSVRSRDRKVCLFKVSNSGSTTLCHISDARPDQTALHYL